MNYIKVAMILFVILESLNVIIMYFKPDFKQGNGVGVFRAYEKSTSDPNVHDLVQYLVYWVAGTKLIMIALILVIVIFGDEKTQLYGALALIVSICSFFWKMYPLIKKIDKNNQLEPSGYSSTLWNMIITIVSIFSIALILTM